MNSRRSSNLYERIVVPLDGSATAENVLPYIQEFAAQLGSEIILVSVSEAAGNMNSLYRSYLDRVSARIEKQMAEWGAKGAKVHSEVLEGNAPGEILHFIDNIDAGLVGLTSRGSSGQAWLMGNVAAKILRTTTRPVLMVRAPVKNSALHQKAIIKRILLPLDGSQIGEGAISRAEPLARALSAEIILFQVVEPVSVVSAYGDYPAYTTLLDTDRIKTSALQYLNDVGRRLQSGGLKVSAALDFGSPASQIVDYAAANNIDLIAMSTHGRSGMGRWVLGSVTDKVLHAGDTPVLVVRASQT